MQDILPAGDGLVCPWWASCLVHDLEVWLQRTVTDAGGRVNIPVTPLVFTREAFPLMKGIGYQPLPSPGIQAIT